jgi:hypothetical protein
MSPKKFILRGLQYVMRQVEGIGGAPSGPQRTPALLKAGGGDMPGRFREIISDPLNVLIERVPHAGLLDENEVILHNGNRVAVAGSRSYYAEFSQILILNRGVHEPLEEFVFQEVLRRLPGAPIMIELGAYWGHYSMWLKKVRPMASVILVEPEAKNLRVGRHNFSRNGYSGEFIEAFVGPGQFEVDAFLEARNISHLDILHVDIQGHEIKMLDGARRTLERAAIDYMFISTHNQRLHTGVIEKLKAHNYRVESDNDFDDETTSFDGFVFASCPNIEAVFDRFPKLGRIHILNSDSSERLNYLNAVRSATKAEIKKI